MFFRGALKIEAAKITRLALAAVQKTDRWKSGVLKKFAYIVGGFFKKAILLRSKIKNNEAPYPR